MAKIIQKLKHAGHSKAYKILLGRLFFNFSFKNENITLWLISQNAKYIENAKFIS
jgi:hypothetical protein